MALELKKFPVPWAKQGQGWYCGPACAQMVLAFLGWWRTQDYLWGVITAKTAGTRDPNAPLTPGWYGSQHCYNCGAWHCWDTLPDVLAATLNAELASSRFRALWSTTIDAAITALVDSIRDVPQVPPCATIWGVNHWVVVTGYHAGDDLLPTAPPIDVDGLPLNGVYINDPQWLDDTQTIRLVPTLQFRRALGIIKCGPNTDRHPLVVGWDRYRLLRMMLAWIRFKSFTLRRDGPVNG